MKSRLAVAVLFAAVTLAGCSANDSSPTVAASPAPPATRPSAPATEGCDSPGPAVTVTAEDNGSVVCLTTGGVLTLDLGTGWKAAKVDSTVLKAAGASKFTAATEGKTTITSSHAACPTATKGAVSCGAVQAFQVQVVVS
jgi:hypothetical protein